MATLNNITNGKAAALLYAKFMVRDELSMHYDPLIISHEETISTTPKFKLCLVWFGLVCVV